MGKYFLCPECDSKKGFDENECCLNCGTYRINKVQNETMSIPESIGTNLEEKILLRDRHNEKITLILLTISVIVTSIIPAIDFWLPISILAGVFIGSFPLGITTYYVKKTITIQYGNK